MRVLMFGWECSPFKSGGLGTACQGMATALAKKGTEILLCPCPVPKVTALSICRTA